MNRTVTRVSQRIAEGGAGRRQTWREASQLDVGAGMVHIGARSCLLALPRVERRAAAPVRLSRYRLLSYTASCRAQVPIRECAASKTEEGIVNTSGNRSAACVVLVVLAALAAACGSSAPTAPTSLPSPAPPGGTSVVRREPTSFTMTGGVTDDTGMPIAGAKVSIWLDYEDLATVRTDGGGRFALDFVAAPGANHIPGHDPAGTEYALAFVNVEAAGYEPYSRYALGTSAQLVETIRLRRVLRIGASESTTVTVEPDDSVCVLDVWPGRERICRTLRIVSPRSGLLTVEAVAVNPGSMSPSLELYGADAGAPRSNPTVLPITGGAEYVAHVGLPWGTAGGSAITVRTLFSPF